jgi:hypothetical protein
MDRKNIYKATMLGLAVVAIPLAWGLYKCNIMNLELTELSLKLEGKASEQTIDQATRLLCDTPEYQKGLLSVVNKSFYRDDAPVSVAGSEVPAYLQDFHTLLDASRKQSKQPPLPSLNDILTEKSQAVAFCAGQNKG